MSIAEIDINSLVGGATGFALATFFHQLIRVRYDEPAQRARDEKRDAQHAEMTKQIGRLADVVNTLVIQNTADMQKKFDILRDLISHHDTKENPAH